MVLFFQTAHVDADTKLKMSTLSENIYCATYLKHSHVNPCTRHKYGKLLYSGTQFVVVHL